MGEHTERRQVRGRWRAVAVWATTLALTTSALTSGAAGASPAPMTQPPSVAPVTAPPPVATSPEQATVLPRTMPARRALQHLDRANLVESAGQVGLAPGDYRRLVRRDGSYWMAPSGATYAVDPAPQVSPAHHGVRPSIAAPRTTATGAEDEDTSGPTGADTDDVLALHSLPGADFTLFIDVDGGRSGAAWEELGARGTYPAWDPDGDRTELSASEERLLRQVWEAVAADYEPFNIDVTTEDPGPAMIARTHTDDPTYGVTIALTHQGVLPDRVCGGSCAGVAFIDVFDTPHTSQRLGWVFTDRLGADPHLIATTVSHEAAHTLGLHHDGSSVQETLPEYYAGHGHWNTIMGLAHPGRPLTQWSKGDYPHAVQQGTHEQEDDIAVLADQLGFRRDEAGDTHTAAVDLPAAGAAGVIASAADSDTYRLGRCAGRITIEARPTTALANLDIELELLDRTGLVARANPDNSVTDGGPDDLRRVTGLAATIDRSVPRRDYWVRVGGGGYGTWPRDGDDLDDPAAGYDDYGSVGGYELTSTCTTSGRTGSHTTLTVETDRSRSDWKSRRTLTATVSLADHTAAVGTVIFRDSGVELASVVVQDGAASHGVEGLAPHSVHRFSAEFVPAQPRAVMPSWSAEHVATVLGPTELEVRATRQGKAIRLDTVVEPTPFGEMDVAINGTRYPDALTVTGWRPWYLFRAMTGNRYRFVLTWRPDVGPPVSRAVSVAKAPARLKVKARKKVRKGRRTKLVSRVLTQGAPATGKVRFRTKGWRRTVRLDKRGRAKVRSPKLRRGRKQRFVVRYLGNNHTRAVKQKVVVRIRR